MKKKKSGGPAMPPREALLLSFVPIILAKIGNNYYLLQNRMIENDLVGSARLHFVLLTRVSVTARERIVVIPCFQILH